MHLPSVPKPREGGALDIQFKHGGHLFGLCAVTDIKGNRMIAGEWWLFR